MTPQNTPGFPVALLLAAALALAVPAAAPTAPQEDAGATRVDAASTTEEVMAQARAAFTVRNYKLARHCYEEVLRRDRTNLTAMLELSNVYERTGKLEYARGLLIRATRIDPDYPAIEERRRSVEGLLVAELTADVDSLLGRGDYDAAMAKLSMHHTIDPRDASVRYKRALCMFEMGSLEAARTEIEAAVALSPLEPYFVLRDRIVGEIRSTEVQQLAERARRLAESNNPRHREQALELVDRILELEPEHSWARNERVRLVEAEDGGVAAISPDGAGDEPSTVSMAFQSVVLAVMTLGRFSARHLTALLLLIAALVVFRSPLTKIISRRLTRPSLLSGDLSRFPVAEILTMLNAQSLTGVLDVLAPGGHGRAFFDGGEPCHCTAGKLDGEEALMSLVNNTRKGRFVFRAGSIPPQRSIDTPLSLLLVEDAHKRDGERFRPPADKKSKMKELLDSKL